jgi:hypothetical protein
MSNELVLLELSTKGLVGIHVDVINITSKGVIKTNRGAFSLLSKGDIFIPFDQIAAVEVIKLLMGLQYDFIITSTSGKRLELKNVPREQAETAKNLINESKSKILNINGINNMYNDNSSNMDTADQLLKLSKLKDSGILTQEEFDSQKKKILGI